MIQTHYFLLWRQLIINRLTLFITVALLSLNGVAAESQRYHAEATVAVINITPEAAKIRAREDAYSEIIAQGAGVKVYDELVVLNGHPTHFRRIHHLGARVVNGECEYRNSSQPLQVTAICRGEVVRYGESGPALQASLERLPADARQCQGETISAATPLLQLRSGERFCLRIASAETLYIGVYAQFNDTTGQLRFNRLWATAAPPGAMTIAAGQPWLSPVIASAPLPGQRESLESVLIIASRRPEFLVSDAGALGSSASRSAEQSLSAAEFDQLLSALNLEQLTLQSLPFIVIGDE
ncbi:MAG: hypothetical protein HQL49_11735 [Gammaproteobacteria bacterium]|nr:hypothetical protein [Gammaproteobacteria bacterium]